MAKETGDISGNFRSRRPSIDRKLKEIQDQLKNLTSHRKKSVNQTLNFSVVLAHQRIQNMNTRKDSKRSEISEIENEIENLDSQLKQALEF